MAKQQGASSAKAKAKKRIVKVESEGKVFLNATFNNLIVTFTNLSGQAISWSSAGKVGFRGSKKNTPYAAQMASIDAVSYTHLDVYKRQVSMLRPVQKIQKIRQNG